MTKEELLLTLKQQLNTTNMLKQEQDKEIKRCRKTMHALQLSNKSLQDQSEKLWKQIQDIEKDELVLSSSTINTINSVMTDVEVADLNEAYTSMTYINALDSICKSSYSDSAQINSVQGSVCGLKKQFTIKDKTFVIDYVSGEVEDIKEAGLYSK